MAERTAGGGKGEARKPSDFIAALVKDPKNPPEIVEVTGFIGAAVEQGRTRIYLDTTLQNYVEVMEDKILHVEPVAEGQLGLSHIFIAADAQIFMPEVEGTGSTASLSIPASLRSQTTESSRLSPTAKPRSSPRWAGRT